MRQRRVELLAQIRRQRFVMRVKIGADFRGQREAGRHRQAEPRHFGEAGALPPSSSFIDAAPSASP